MGLAIRERRDGSGYVVIDTSRGEAEEVGEVFATREQAETALAEMQPKKFAASKSEAKPEKPAPSGKK